MYHQHLRYQTPPTRQAYYDTLDITSQPTHHLPQNTDVTVTDVNHYRALALAYTFTIQGVPVLTPETHTHTHTHRHTRTHKINDKRIHIDSGDGDHQRTVCIKSTSDTR